VHVSKDKPRNICIWHSVAMTRDRNLVAMGICIGWKSNYWMKTLVEKEKNGRNWVFGNQYWDVLFTGGGASNDTVKTQGLSYSIVFIGSKTEFFL
jgi:hypothetical protein